MAPCYSMKLLHLWGSAQPLWGEKLFDLTFVKYPFYNNEDCLPSTIPHPLFSRIRPTSFWRSSVSLCIHFFRAWRWVLRGEAFTSIPSIFSPPGKKSGRSNGNKLAQCQETYMNVERSVPQLLDTDRPRYHWEQDRSLLLTLSAPWVRERQCLKGAEGGNERGKSHFCAYRLRRSRQVCVFVSCNVCYVFPNKLNSPTSTEPSHTRIRQKY